MKTPWYRSASTWLALSTLSLGMLLLLTPGSVFKGPEAPAWVQAVGPVIAIFVAIWVPAHHRRMQERDAAAAAYVGITKLLLEACVVLQSRMQKIQAMTPGDPPVPPINDRVLEDWLIRLRSVDALLVKPSKLGIHKIVLRNMFSSVTRTVTRDGIPEDVKTIAGLIEGLSKLQAPMKEIARNFGAEDNLF